jgi:NDP-sugar pyrophosphorylase family protein
VHASALALVMAGGRSERMRASLGSLHKSLVPILGVPLLERNLLALLSEGFNAILVCYSANEAEVEQYLKARGRELVESRNATLELVREEHPLGTIGAASRLKMHSGPLLVVNVDNLTTLSLRTLVAHHVHAKAALTIAVHSEPFRIPFGEVTVREGEVVGYSEKPLHPVTISSGTYVLSAECRRVIPQEQRFDIPALFTLVTGMKKRVAAFEHNAAWIDVNDAAAVSRAEQLILDNYNDFELWKTAPDGEVTELFQYDGACVSRVLPETCAEQVPILLASFDQLCIPSGRLIRHNVCVLPGGAKPTGAGNQAWLSLDENTQGLSATMQRSLAVIRRYLVGREGYTRH